MKKTSNEVEKKKLMNITSRSGRNQNTVLNQRLKYISNQIIGLKLNVDFKLELFFKDVLIFKFLLLNGEQRELTLKH